MFKLVIKCISYLFLFFMPSMNFIYATKNTLVADPNVAKLISVREDAFIYTFTTEGKHWSMAKGLTGHANFNAVIYANNVYVAVADESTIWYSRDYENWFISQSLSGEANLNTVAYGAGVFVAIGGESTSWYSTDGVNWTKGTGLSGESTYTDIIYAEEQFVAVGWDKAIAVSNNGKQWRTPTQTPSGDINFYSIAYGKGDFEEGKFVAVGSLSTIWYSADGDNWSLAQGLSGSTSFNAATFAENTFVAVGTMGTIYYSDNGGSRWQTAKNLGPDITFNSVTYGKGTFVAVGDLDWNVTSSPVWYSKDGVTWHPGSGIKFDNCYNDFPYFDVVIFSHGVFTAAADTPANSLPSYYSRDGINWESNQEGFVSKRFCRKPSKEVALLPIMRSGRNAS